MKKYLIFRLLMSSSTQTTAVWWQDPWYRQKSHQSNYIFQLFHVQVQNFEFKPNFSFIFKIICAAIISVYIKIRGPSSEFPVAGLLWGSCLHPIPMRVNHFCAYYRTRVRSLAMLVTHSLTH